MKKVRSVLLVLVFYLLFAKSAFAVTITIENPPANITEDPFSLQVNISGAQAATNYLRIDIYKDGTTDYFGYTSNGSDWYNKSDYQQYLPVTISESGSWVGEVKGRLDTAAKEYKGPGTYKLRIRRYTASGNYSSS